MPTPGLALLDVLIGMAISMHPDEFVVITNSLGQHTLTWRDQLIDRDIDLSKMGTLPRPRDFGDRLEDPLPENLEGGAFWLRYCADLLIEVAET